MAAAYIDGQSVALRDAIREAARLLERARNPVIAGLGTDIAGVRAAIRLAERLGCSFDHLASDAVLASIEAMRDSGWMTVSPQEGRRLADVVLLAGGFSKAEGAAVIQRLPPPPCSIVLLGTAASARQFKSAGYAVEALPATEATLPGLLAALRARVAGRPAAGDPAKLDRLADMLKAAKFGVAIWSPEALDRHQTEMLCGLVKDLNAGTRFSGFPLPASGNGAGVAQASGWLTGFPMRTGFGRGGPEHDPWRLDADRLVGDEEADAALWISAYEPAAPHWTRALPLVALTTGEPRFAQVPKVRFEVGTPGIDHDAVQWNGATGALAPVTASSPSDRPRTDEIIAAIDSAMTEGGA